MRHNDSCIAAAGFLMQPLIFGDERMSGVAMQRVQDFVMTGIIRRCLRTIPRASRPRLQLCILTEPGQRSGASSNVWVTPDILARSWMEQELVSVNIAQPNEVGEARLQNYHRILKRNQNIRVEKKSKAQWHTP